MALAGDHDERVAEELRHFDRRRHRAQMRDRDIDRAALQLFCGFAAVQWQKAQGRSGRLARKGFGETADQRDLGVFPHAGGECGEAGRRIEAGAEVERRLDLLDRRRDQRRDLTCPRGRFHAVRGAHEEFVREQAAQARQRVAHRRL